jgi:hypothetical protein
LPPSIHLGQNTRTQEQNPTQQVKNSGTQQKEQPAAANNQKLSDDGKNNKILC